MVTLRSHVGFIAMVLATNSIAQTTSTDPLGIIVSEAYSIYTEVTGSYLPSVESAASAASASAASASAASVSSDEASHSTASRSSAHSRSSAPSRSLTSTLATSTSASSASTTSPTKLAASATSASSAAAASSTSASGSKHHGGSNTLAIALGTALGALALGLLILALLLCCRRRRRRRESVRHSGLPPSDDEVHSWRRPSRYDKHATTSNKELLGSAPLMSEHPAYRHDRELENPFADPVPAERQLSAPNSRAGLTDGTVPGDDPYLMDKGNGHPIRHSSDDSHHHGEALAAGVGGAALGAAAMHHHNKHDNKSYDEKFDPDYRRSRPITRKPVPSTNVDTGSVDPYPTTTANDDAFALNRTPGRRSTESARSRPSRDAARANAAFDNQYAPTSGDHHHHGVSTAAALGGGALAGAAVAHHKRNRSRSNSNGRSPRRHSLLASKERYSDNSNTSSDSYNSNQYSDAVAQQTEAGIASKGKPHEPPIDIPPTPPTRSRRNSALGTAAPAAALGSYVNYPREERSTSRPRSYPTIDTDVASANATNKSRASTPPAVPSRSPRRSRFSNEAPRNESPLRHQLEPFDLGNPYDDAMRGGAAFVTAPTGPGQHHQRQRSATTPPTVGNSRMPAGSSNNTSDDSTWRLSQGMPGGWQRAQPVVNGGRRSASARNSLDTYSPISPVIATGAGVMNGNGNGNSHSHTNGHTDNNRDSAISGSTAVSGGRRLRLADLRREEEERERMRSSGYWFGSGSTNGNVGKQNMGSEWYGNGGYDGFDPYDRRNSAGSGRFYEGHEGVGQAL